MKSEGWQITASPAYEERHFVDPSEQIAIECRTARKLQISDLPAKPLR